MLKERTPKDSCTWCSMKKRWQGGMEDRMGGREFKRMCRMIFGFLISCSFISSIISNYKPCLGMNNCQNWVLKAKSKWLENKNTLTARKVSRNWGNIAWRKKFVRIFLLPSPSLCNNIKDYLKLSYWREDFQNWMPKANGKGLRHKNLIKVRESPSKIGNDEWDNDDDVLLLLLVLGFLREVIYQE